MDKSKRGWQTNNNSPATLAIKRDALAEIMAIAANCPTNTSALSYSETQAYLVLHGLKEWLVSYGLEPQFSLEVLPKKLPPIYGPDDVPPAELKFDDGEE